MSASPSRLRYAAKSSSRPTLLRRGVDDPQGGALRGPARVAVDRVLRRQPGRQLPDELVDRVPLVLGQRGVLGDPLDAEVDRVEEPARAGQVRRGLQRRQRLGGVQRVDQDEVGTQLAGRPDSEVGEVGEVAEAPAAAGADAVELGRETPLALPVGPLGEAEPGGRHDQVGAGHGVAAAGLEQVVAERQVGRHRERRLADAAALDLAGRDPVVDLVGPAGAAVLELDPHLDAVAVGHVHRHPAPPGPPPPPRSAAASAATARAPSAASPAPGRRCRRPWPRSTASIVSAVTWTGRPRQSAYSVMTPYACASSTSGPVGDVTARVCQPSRRPRDDHAARAGDRSRTRDISLTRRTLYQLSYTGEVRRTS